MQSKLAWKNAARSIEDYAVYFITLVLGVCVFYMFNSIYSQQAMLGLTAQMTQSAQSLQKMLSYVSVFVAIVLGFLIVYANLFFIKRRKKEMGIYLILGMEKREVSVILFSETAIIAVLALLAGLAAGVVLSQFMSVVTGRMFAADLAKLSFVFSSSALIKSVLCFSVDFCVVIAVNIIVIGRYKLIDLIYEDRKNEVLIAPDKKIIVVIFAGSVAMVAFAYYLILQNGIMNIGPKFLCSILFGVSGTLLFFFSLSVLLIRIIQANQSVYFRNLNMFVVRQLANRINTNYISISVVSLVLFFAISIFAVGYGMQEVMSKEMEGYAGYDFSFIGFYAEKTAEDPLVTLREYLDEQPQVANSYQFTLYTTDYKYGDFGVELASDVALWENEQVSFVALSDYNRAMASQGFREMKLEASEYALLTNFHSMNEFAKTVLEKKYPIELSGISLRPKKAVVGSMKNGLNQAIFIVNDCLVSAMAAQERVLNVNCKNRKAALDFEKIFLEENKVETQLQQYYYISREKLLADAMGGKALLSYLSIYLGLVFLIECVAILAIQQLTEAADHKLRYRLLKNLGADKSMIHRALFLQILCYFLAPLPVAVVHAYFGLRAAAATLDMYGKMNIAKSSAVAAVFVVGLYVIYFVITYLGCKNTLKEDKIK